MKKALRITVKNKIATYLQRDGVIVCGNKGYKIAFTFDEEWDAYTNKIARFIWNGKYFDKTFTGDECDVPVINDATEVTVGVYAGDLKTTTPAVIPCLISILCGNPEVGAEMVEEYREKALIAAEEAKAAAEEAKAAAEVVVHPVVGVTTITGGHRVTITDVEGTKTFDVMDGEGVLTDDDAALLEKLSDWYDSEHYTPMTVSLSPSSTTYELGSKKTITFAWNFSEEVSSVTFMGRSQNAAKNGSATVEDISTTTTYEVTGTRKDGKKETKSARTTISFHNKFYFGCASEPTTIDNAFLKTLTVHTGWADSRKTFSKTPNCTAGTYIWYAYPARLGESMFKMGGFQGGFRAAQLVYITNDSGYSEPYYVYRSSNSGLGSAIIDVL